MLHRDFNHDLSGWLTTDFNGSKTCSDGPNYSWICSGGTGNVHFYPGIFYYFRSNSINNGRIVIVLVHGYFYQGRRLLCIESASNIIILFKYLLQASIQSMTNFLIFTFRCKTKSKGENYYDRWAVMEFRMMLERIIICIGINLLTQTT